MIIGICAALLIIVLGMALNDAGSKQDRNPAGPLAGILFVIAIIIVLGVI